VNVVDVDGVGGEKLLGGAAGVAEVWVEVDEEGGEVDLRKGGKGEG